MVTGLVFVWGQTFQSKHRSEDLILAKKVDCKFNQGELPDRKRCDRQDWAVHCLGNTDQVAGIRESLVVFDKQSSSVKQKLLRERLRFAYTLSGRREFVPRVQVSPLFSVYSLLLLYKNK